jgi:hypothetical protein
VNVEVAILEIVNLIISKQKTQWLFKKNEYRVEFKIQSYKKDSGDGGWNS